MANGEFAAFGWHRAVLSGSCTLDPWETVVILALVKHANEQGRAWPSFATLCAETRVRRTKLIDSIAELEERGLFVRTAQVRGKGFGSNSYILPLEPPVHGLEGPRRVVRPANQSVTRTSPSGALGSPPREPSVVRHTDGGGPPGEPYLLRDLPTVSAQVTARTVLSSKEQRNQEKQEPDILEVFEFWRTDTGHTGAKLTEAKATFIRARLRDGFTVEQLKQVVTNRHLSLHYMGQNDTGTVYDGIDNLYRSAERVEKILAFKAGRATTDFRAATLVPEPDEAEVARRRARAAATLARAEAERDARYAKAREADETPPRAATGAS